MLIYSPSTNNMYIDNGLITISRMQWWTFHYFMKTYLYQSFLIYASLVIIAEFVIIELKLLNDPIYDFPFKFIKTRIMNIELWISMSILLELIQWKNNILI